MSAGQGWIKMSDLIDRQAAVDALGDAHFKNYGNAILVIKDLPSAEPVRHGKWIDIDEMTYTWKVSCSCCGNERSMMSTQGNYPNYCEACGARMDEE